MILVPVTATLLEYMYGKVQTQFHTRRIDPGVLAPKILSDEQNHCRRYDMTLSQVTKMVSRMACNNPKHATCTLYFTLPVQYILKL